MWRVAAIDLKKPVLDPGMPLLNSAYAVAAVAVPVAGCSAPTISAPAPSQSTPSTTSPAKTSAQAASPHTQTVTLTSSIAPFTLPAAVSRPTVFSASEGLLVVGGLTTADNTTQAILRVDLTRGTVNQAGRLPIPVHDAAGALAGGRDLVLGGGSTAVTSAVQDVMPGASCRVISHLPQHPPRPLAHAGAFTLGGSVFVTGSTATDEVMRFDPANVSFTAAGHLPAARSDFSVAVVGGTAYLVGGENPKPVDTVIQVRAQAGGSP
jgi:hypothetical protein